MGVWLLMKKPEPTWRGLFETWLGAVIFYLSGVFLSSEVFERQGLVWKILMLGSILMAMQGAHYLFERAYKRQYFSPPKDVLVQVKSELGNIERIITPQPGGTYIIQIYDKTVNIELKEDKQ